MFNYRRNFNICNYYYRQLSPMKKKIIINSFLSFRIRYNFFICYIVCTRGVHSVGSNVENSIRFVSLLDRIFSLRLVAKSNVEYSTFRSGSIECRIFDIRSAISRKSNIRHPMHVRSNVKNPTSEEGHFGCQIIDIRRRPISN